MIYHYELNTEDNEGRPGIELFQSDLRTLERAATLNTPGPRIVAHAVTDDEAFILATTPATHRALLSEANGQARDWLAAMQLSGEAASADQVDFHPEETGLALFLMDESNIRQLLQVLNVMVQSARADLPRQNGAEPV